MGLRRINLGAVDILLSFPDGLGRRLRTLGGLLPTSSVREGDRKPQPIQNERSDECAELQARIDQVEWYHTIDLGSGAVTPGWFDLRPLLHHYPIPERLDGLRVLDVATFDGFWAFEFERRGAAEVVALDIDTFADLDMAPRVRRQKTPEFLARKTGEGFKICHEVLKSKVRREILNVYELSPDKVGRFDLVFISDVLLHLVNPMKALSHVCSVTAGRAVIADVYNPRLPGRLMSYESGETHNTWWSMSYGALEQMIHDAGFASVKLCSKFLAGYRDQKPILWHAVFEAEP